MSSRVFFKRLWPLRHIFIQEEKEKGRTRREVFIDWPVVHLQSGVTPVPGEAHQVVFAVVDGGAGLLHADVHCPDVEGHADFALLLEGKKKSSLLVDQVPSSVQLLPSILGFE